MSLSLWDLLSIIGAASASSQPGHFPLAPVAPVPRPNRGGQGAAATSLWVLQAPLCTSAQQADNGWCCRGPSHLFPALSGIPGAGPSPRRQRLRGQGFRAQPSWQEWRGFAFMQISHVLSHSKALHRKKTFPVFGSGWAAPARG